MSVTTARQRVLSYLRKNRAVSASQIGRALNMSAVNVRHHLSILTSDGRVVEASKTRREGRGRPVKLYDLSEHLLGNNLALLSDLLLDGTLGRLSPVQRDELMKSVAGRLIGNLSEADSNVPLARQLALVVDRLNQLNYQARWEAGAEGPHIIFGHCPYAVIIAKHPELCAMDATMLERSLGQPVGQLAKIEAGSIPHCVFRMWRG